VSLQILLFCNVGQKPFGNNLLPPVRAFERRGVCRVVEPRAYGSFASTGGARPAPIPSAAVVDGLDGFVPDLVVCLGGGLCLADQDRARLPARAVLVGIALSDPLGLDTSLEIAPDFDLFYTQDPQTIDHYRRAGVEVRRCDLAVDPALSHPVDVEADTDLVFVGRWTPYRDEIVRRLLSVCSVRVHAYAREADRWAAQVGPPLDDPAALNEGLCRGRVGLELAYLDVGPAGFRGTCRITPRAFFAAACGIPTLIESFPLLTEFFDLGSEVATFAGLDDVADAATALLADDEARLAMGRRARARVIRDHTWDLRATMIAADAGIARGDARDPRS